MQSSRAGGVAERRGRLAAEDSRCLEDEHVVLDCRHHKLGKSHAARHVARQKQPFRVAVQLSAAAQPSLGSASRRRDYLGGDAADPYE